MRHLTSTLIRCFLLGVLTFSYVTSSALGAGFYKESKGLFSTRPSETKSLQTIARFGPVGIGIELLQPAFTMRIKNVEEGSPAATTGRLQKGQVIETINGQKLAEIDPRIQLGQILAAAEASDGLLKFAIKGEAEAVPVTAPVLRQDTLQDGWHYRQPGLVVVRR
jgi:predicted metalloprotease with PDZ domain